MDFWKRFVAAQTEVQGVVKTENRDDRGGKYNYADIGNVIQTIRDAFNKHDIAFNLVAVPPAISGHDPATQVAVEAVFSADDGEHRGGPVVTNIPYHREPKSGIGNSNAIASGQAYGFCKRYAAITGAGLPELNPEDVQDFEPNQPVERQNQRSDTRSTRQPQNNSPTPRDTAPQWFIDELKEYFMDESFRNSFRIIFLGGLDGPRPKFPDDMLTALDDRNVPLNMNGIIAYMEDQPDNTYQR